MCPTLLADHGNGGGCSAVRAVARSHRPRGCGAGRAGRQTVAAAGACRCRSGSDGGSRRRPPGSLRGALCIRQAQTCGRSILLAFSWRTANGYGEQKVPSEAGLTSAPRWTDSSSWQRAAGEAGRKRTAGYRAPPHARPVGEWTHPRVLRSLRNSVRSPSWPRRAVSKQGDRRAAIPVVPDRRLPPAPGLPQTRRHLPRGATRRAGRPADGRSHQPADLDLTGHLAEAGNCGPLITWSPDRPTRTGEDNEHRQERRSRTRRIRGRIGLAGGLSPAPAGWLQGHDRAEPDAVARG